MARRNKKAKKRSGGAALGAASQDAAPQDVLFRPLKGALAELREKFKEPQHDKTDSASSSSGFSAKPAKSAKRKLPAQEHEKAPAKKVDQRTYDERMALQQAYQGVRPLEASRQGRRGKVAAPPALDPAQDAAMREEALRPVHRLVADGVRFVVDEDEDGHVRAHRASRGKQALDPLKSGKAKPEASVDLHGFREAPARQMLQRWLRAERERGRRVVRIVHGQGHHSVGGAVLREAVRSELERGLCAAYVDAFITASRTQGGQGALLVVLRRR